MALRDALAAANHLCPVRDKGSLFRHHREMALEKVDLFFCLCERREIDE